MALDQTVFGWNFTSEKIRALLVFFVLLKYRRHPVTPAPNTIFQIYFLAQAKTDSASWQKFALEDNEMKEGVFAQHKDSWVKVHHTLGIQGYIPHSPMKRNTKWKFQT